MRSFPVVCVDRLQQMNALALLLNPRVWAALSIVYTYWLVLAALATVRPQPCTRTTDRISCTSLIFLGYFDKCRTTNQSSLSFDPDRTCLFFVRFKERKAYIRALFIQSMLYIANVATFHISLYCYKVRELLPIVVNSRFSHPFRFIHFPFRRKSRTHQVEKVWVSSAFCPFFSFFVLFSSRFLSIVSVNRRCGNLYLAADSWWTNSSIHFVAYRRPKVSIFYVCYFLPLHLPIGIRSSPFMTHPLLVYILCSPSFFWYSILLIIQQRGQGIAQRMLYLLNIHDSLRHVL